MIRGTFETRNFTFEAFGTTRTQVVRLLKQAWLKHAREENADLAYFDWCGGEDAVTFDTVELGVVLRDHETFLEPKVIRPAKRRPRQRRYDESQERKPSP